MPPSIVDTRSSTDLVVREKEKVFLNDDNRRMEGMDEEKWSISISHYFNCDLFMFCQVLWQIIFWQPFSALDNFWKPLSMCQIKVNLTCDAMFVTLQNRFIFKNLKINWRWTWLARQGATLSPNILKSLNKKVNKLLKINFKVNLTCEARGYPQPQIMWRREDGRSITANGHTKKGFEHFLDVIFSLVSIFSDF